MFPESFIHEKRVLSRVCYSLILTGSHKMIIEQAGAHDMVVLFVLGGEKRHHTFTFKAIKQPVVIEVPIILNHHMVLPVVPRLLCLRYAK